MALLRSLGGKGGKGRKRYLSTHFRSRADNSRRMHCPACHAELSPVTLAGVTLDACQRGCGGIWFDRGELKFDPRAALLDQWLDELSAGHSVHVDPTPPRHCPRCANSVLVRHFSSATRAVTIDECPTCAGVWLDSGELERIRSERVPAEDRRRAVVRVFEERAIDDRMALIAEQLDMSAPYATWRSRVASSVIAALYLGLAAAGPFNAYSSVADLARVLGFCLLPLACIWFPDELARRGGRWTFRGLTSGRRASPRSFVWFVGWVVLLLPVTVVAILWLQGVTFVD
jgi:Zn-finger nucleic acid-binding protein